MPVSIKRFSWSFLTLIALNVVYSLMTFDHQRNQLARNPQTAGFGDSLIVISLLFGTAFLLLFWFMIVHRASNVAKWVLVFVIALVSIWTLSSLSAANRLEALPTAVSVAGLVLQLVSVVFLFAPDARAWLGRRHAADDVPVDESPAA